MKKYHLFLPLLGILLLVSGGCSKRKEPKPLITEAPAVETEIGGYITETESSTPESQSCIRYDPACRSRNRNTKKNPAQNPKLFLHLFI